MSPRITFLAAIAALAWVQTASAVEPAVKCETSKLKEVAKYASCRLKAEAKGVQTNTTPDYSKCEGKFTPKFESLDTKFGVNVCPTEGDEASINAQVTNDSNTLAMLLSGARYEDCGDGTVADLQTGLMWYKTDDAGGLTDKDNQYALSAPFSSENNGTAYTILLAGLNNCESNDGSTVTGGYGGHCDWRLPQNDELQTLLLEPFPCSMSPCIDEAQFGPTIAAFYASATAVAIDPTKTYGVRFSDGGAQAQSAKTLASYVRAVRSGRCP